MNVLISEPYPAQMLVQALACGEVCNSPGNGAGGGTPNDRAM